MGDQVVELWLGLTIAAAFVQNLRVVLQRSLTGRLSVNGATWVRFVYALPFAWLVCLWIWGGELPRLGMEFFAYLVLGASGQILATAWLLASFRHSAFAVGTALSKTEAAQAALFGIFLLGDGISTTIALGLIISLIGVIMLSVNVRDFSWEQIDKRAVWLGIGSGAGFALAAVGFRGASLAVPTQEVFAAATLTVAFAVTLQTVMLAAYLRWREPGEIGRVLGVWRKGALIGVLAMAASAGWFAAMTLQNAGVVRAVGQIELIFALATSVWFLNEKVQLREVAGIGLLVMGILLLI